MKDFVGITHSGRINSSLKREALIFNKIGIYDLNGIEQQAQYESARLEELEWLLEQGIVFNIEPKRTAFIDDTSALKSTNINLKDADAELSNTEQKRTSLSTEEFNYKHQKLVGELKGVSKELREVQLDFRDITCRAYCFLLRYKEGLDAFPLFYNEKISLPSKTSDKADVVRVVLNALPIPDYKTSWEQIIEYRSDPDSLGKFLALRRWMTKTAKAQLSIIEIEEELEWLLYDYQRHLELHRLKVNVGAIETILTVGAAFLENLAKVNWGEAAKLLFTFKHRKIELLEAEMKSPGSEVAYVLGAWKQFNAEPNNRLQPTPR